MIEFRLSGGAANSNPALSIGGVMSSVSASGETVSANGAAISGVTLVSSANNIRDTSGSANSATLRYTPGTPGLLTFCPYLVAAGTVAEDSNNRKPITGNGSYSFCWVQDGATRSLTVNVVTASLPVVETTCKLNIQASSGTLFPDSTADDAQSADVRYRCVYVYNSSAVSAAVRLFLARAPAGSTIALALDSAGVNANAATIANDKTAPGAVTWAHPRTYTDGMAITLPAGARHALWLRRSVTPFLPTRFQGDGLSLLAQVAV